MFEYECVIMLQVNPIVHQAVFRVSSYTVTCTHQTVNCKYYLYSDNFRESRNLLKGLGIVCSINRNGGEMGLKNHAHEELA